MEPTTRALEIAEPVAEALAQLRAAIARDETFDAASARRVFAQTVAGPVQDDAAQHDEEMRFNFGLG